MQDYDGRTTLLILESFFFAVLIGWFFCLCKSPNAMRSLGYWLLTKAKANEEITEAKLGINRERLLELRRLEQRHRLQAVITDPEFIENNTNA